MPRADRPQCAAERGGWTPGATQPPADKGALAVSCGAAEAGAKCCRVAPPVLVRFGSCACASMSAAFCCPAVGV